MMITRRSRIQVRKILRKIFHHDDPAPRIARGVAAGFFAAAFPLPGLQIPLSLLLAWMIRGNRAVSIFPQFLSNMGTILPLAYLQFRIGALFWPARAEQADEALARLGQAFETWSWLHPLEALMDFFTVLGGCGHEFLGPLGIGILITGTLMAAMAYPVTIVGVWTWRRRRRAKRPLPEPPAPWLLRTAAGAALAREAVIARYALAPEKFLRAETVSLLVDGRAAYPQMLAAIDSARASVELETYILRADRTGKRFAEALSGAALRGVRVRLLYDAVGSRALPGDFIESLGLSGVRVGVYHPLLFGRPTWAINRRDHRKILIVDRETAFTGGLNIADEYAAPEEGGGGWRDTQIRLDGTAAADALLELFEYAWQKSKSSIPEHGSRLARLFAPLGKKKAVAQGKHEAHARDPGHRAASGGVLVQVLGNREFRNRREIRRAYLHAIQNAERYLLIENAFFIPDRGIRRALAHAVKRGVQVAVAVARESDVPIASAAGRALYSELLASGVRIFEWHAGMLHAKTAVVDDAWAVVGSYNINRRSLIHDLEAVVGVADPRFALRLREQTLADIAHCRELTLAEHESRSWRQMLWESAAFQMRYWL